MGIFEYLFGTPKERAERYLTKAEKAREGGRSEKARKRYLKAATYFEKAGNLEMAGQCYEEGGNFEKASESYSKSGQFHKLAKLLAKQGKLEDAKFYYEQVLNDPNAALDAFHVFKDNEKFSGFANRAMSIYQERIGNLQKAFEYATKSDDPGLAGQLAEKLEKYDKAISFYSKSNKLKDLKSALDLLIKHPELYNDRAVNSIASKTRKKPEFVKGLVKVYKNANQLEPAISLLKEIKRDEELEKELFDLCADYCLELIAKGKAEEASKYGKAALRRLDSEKLNKIKEIIDKIEPAPSQKEKIKFYPHWCGRPFEVELYFYVKGKYEDKIYKNLNSFYLYDLGIYDGSVFYMDEDHLNAIFITFLGDIEPVDKREGVGRNLCLYAKEEINDINRCLSLIKGTLSLKDKREGLRKRYQWLLKVHDLPKDKLDDVHEEDVISFNEDLSSMSFRNIKTTKAEYSWGTKRISSTEYYINLNLLEHLLNIFKDVKNDKCVVVFPYRENRVLMPGSERLYLTLTNLYKNNKETKIYFSYSKDVGVKDKDWKNEDWREYIEFYSAYEIDEYFRVKQKNK